MITWAYDDNNSICLCFKFLCSRSQLPLCLVRRCHWKKWLIGLLWASFFCLKTAYESFFGFIFTKFWFISIIYLRSILFEFFVLFILMLFGHVYHTTISFTWWIVRTMSLLISITFAVYLMPKLWMCFFRTTFFYIS